VEKPRLAITMGDAAGIGPEICVKALARAESYELCRPFIIGDEAILAEAARLVDVDLGVRRIDTPQNAVFTHGTIDVLQPGDPLIGVRWGELSAAAGGGSVAFVKAAATLGRARRIDGIVTAPLNKEAIHAAGSLYPGHTELLAELFEVEQFSLVLSAGDVFVFHVTTHMALRDAIDAVTAERIQATIELAHHFARALGRDSTTIFVVGLNPPASEHGLFGDEEAERLTPAIERVRDTGIAVEGPLPADAAIPAVFKRGDGFLVVCYHDQGHAPFKAVYGDAGVNITVGLPVVRVSVDHGTAFDIAGRGVARDDSLREAIRRAAYLAPLWDEIYEVMGGVA
jgi:4-phospho-D-threonate 3-dehydrogenase / 4-phospho-D-erythronate 3-dehydrogenase